jgi:hypothetical protein
MLGLVPLVSHTSEFVDLPIFSTTTFTSACCSSCSLRCPRGPKWPYTPTKAVWFWLSSWTDDAPYSEETKCSHDSKSGMSEECKLGPSSSLTNFNSIASHEMKKIEIKQLEVKLACLIISILDRKCWQWLNIVCHKMWKRMLLIIILQF